VAKGGRARRVKARCDFITQRDAFSAGQKKRLKKTALTPQKMLEESVAEGIKTILKN